MSAEEADLPAWRREKIFPEKPGEGAYGLVGEKSQAYAFATFEELEAHLGKEEVEVGLIWTPERERCFPPEEEPQLLEILRRRKVGRFKGDLRRSLVMGGLFALPLLYGVVMGGFSWKALQSQQFGFMAVLWLMFGAIPAYEAWKRLRRARVLDSANLGQEAQEVRFEIWLLRQSVGVTKLLIGMLLGVYLVQVLIGYEYMKALLGALLAPKEQFGRGFIEAGVPAAGLIKENGYFAGEWWRLFTGPMMHANLLHIGMNGLALLYLGRRTEVLAGWPHLVLVYLFALLGGSLASTYGFPDAPAVGASGAILGLLGFLLVFEFLHGRLVPKRATRRLYAGLILTFVVGAVGYRFIDNWAHGGGLVAGMIYAAVVFPKSSSPHRPRPTRLDVVAGGASLLLIVSFALLGVLLMKGSG
ncbi:MAG: rhomboid family intramembrane serine protease [Verrucomicrobiota bacterium]